MKKILLVIFFIAVSSFFCAAQTITWSEDVSCIVFTHCIRCHNNTSSIAAIPFTNYYEAWSQRNVIKTYVRNGVMPPYQPSTSKQNYSHQKNLTRDEIDLIVAWVNQGSNQGDSTLTPPTPVITPLVSEVPAPDIAYRIPPYTVPNLVAFQYHCFVFPTTYPVDKKISEIEIMPTDLSAIYSAFLYADTSSIPLTMDAADTSNGYENYAGIGSPTAKLLYGWVNGNPFYHTPSNTAIRLDANAHLVLKILFAEDALNKTDSTLVNIKFDTSATARFIDVATLLNHNTNLQNPPFIIPADSMKTFYEQYTAPTDISLLSASHWAQKWCSNMSCYAITPANDTISLLEIEDQEQLWSQGVYYFYNPVKIPAGSILYGRAEYDNTSLNQNNPFFPPHTVVAGTSDTTEQMLFSFSFMDYQSGDENIVADSVTHQIHYLNCTPAHTVTGITENNYENSFSVYPNPISEVLNFTSPDNDKFSVNIFNSLGEKIYSDAGHVERSRNIQLSNLPNGIYFLQLISNRKFFSQIFIKQ